MFRVAYLDDTGHVRCECASYTAAREIALALRSHAEPHNRRHYAVLRRDELIYNTREGVTNAM